MNSYVYEYVSKITGETLTTEVQAYNRTQAEKQALKEVFTVALDCEISLIDTDEQDEQTGFSDEDESYIDYLSRGN